jgi:hypothetical protein
MVVSDAFNAGIILGGEMDRIGRIDKLPYPIFPSLTMPKVKGSYIDVPPDTGTYPKIITSNKDLEFISISVACTGYLFPDYWEFYVGNYKVMETIYTKEVPQTVYSGTQMTMVLPIPAGTPMRVDFVNKSGTSKQVYLDLKLLVSPDEADTLVLSET